MNLTLKQALISTSNDCKGKHQSWEAWIGLEDTGLSIWLCDYGESEEEARSNLEAKFQELLRAVSEQIEQIKKNS